MPIPAFLSAALLATGLLLSGHAAAQSPLPPARDFFDNPTFSAPQLSPSGRYLAAKVATESGRISLSVTDLADNSTRLVAHFSDVDIGRVEWLNEDQLLFDSVDGQFAPGDRRYAPGLFVVARDGGKLRQLADRTTGYVKAIRNSRISSVRALLPWDTFMLGQPGAQDSDNTYVTRPHYDRDGRFLYQDLLRLNVTGGKTATVERPDGADGYLLDHRGEPGMATSRVKDERIFWLRDTATGAWRELSRKPVYQRASDAVIPLGFGGDGTLYVVSAAGRDHTAVYTMDKATGALGKQPVLQLDGYDFRGGLVRDANRLLGIRYLTDGWGTAWFDPAMKAVQADIDAQLPDTVNVIDVARQPDAPNVLVTAYSDTQPAAYFVYNRPARRLTKAGVSHSRIRPGQMGFQQWVSYPARDGLPIPALLTLPAGTDKPSKRPMVVLVHDGPWTRGAAWGWNAQAQFLASRGYVVLQPEFRGSIGFGIRHYGAGLKQWGLAMQDDLADGTRWAIAQGYADPQRVCLAGAGYGGYATLMGLIRDPDLYRCGVEWLGVTDMKLMVDGEWFIGDGLSSQYREYGLPHLVGVTGRDGTQLQAVAPLDQAARLRKPLLMAYGARDPYVPLQHGTRLRDALRPHNNDVEWIEYEAEGHGWSLPANRVDFWTRVERFLGRHLANP